MAASRHPTSDSVAQDDKIDPYVIKEEIGRGSFAVVYFGENTATTPPTPVAIKVVTRSKLTPKLLDNLESEIRLLTQISHGNIVELVGCKKTDTHIYIIMAFCASGDLSQYIKRRGLSASIARQFTNANAPLNDRYPNPKDGGLNEVIVRCFLGQLTNAMRFLRSKNVIHRDLKPQNLLLQPADPNGPLAGIPILRVADFGFARFLPQASMAETLCGSPLYMAPEILRYEKYDAKADLWSIGAILYEMVVGKAPFRAQNHVELLRKIERGEDHIKFPDDNPAIPQVPSDIRTLICRLLKRNPKDRMSFEDFFIEGERVASSGVAAGIWPPPAYADPALVKRIAVPPASPVLTRMSSSPHSPSPLRPTMDRQPSDEGAFLPLSRPTPTVRQASFAPKYVVGGSRSPSASQPVDIAAAAGVKYRDYARLSPASASRDADTGRRDRDALPDLVPASLEDRSPLAPATPQNMPNRVRNSASVPLVADDDSVVGREYVVVDRRTVEINALADELSGKRPSPLASGTSSSRRNSRAFMTRLPSNSSGQALVTISGGSSGNSTPYPPVEHGASPPAFALPRTRPSPPLRPPLTPFSSSRSPLGGPTSTIARVISMASLKIFGNPTQGILLRKTPHRKPISRSSVNLDPQEDRLMTEIEDLAQKASVIFDFADSRLIQVLPPTPSMTSGAAVPIPSSLGRANPFAVSGPIAASSTSAEVLAAEALILYLRALVFLQRGIEQARLFWESKDSESRRDISPDFNEAVQWLRTRFNDCFEKADFAKSRCHDEMPESAASAEKLVYDRALEMSRAAAVQELMGESAVDCETAYETALWMLYALLDPTMSDGRPVKDDDRATVEKFVGSIKGRLEALRRKMRAR